MKIKFDSELKYQESAIDSIVNIFEGQEICQSNFTVSGITNSLITYQNELGIGNRLELLDDEMLLNVQNIQLKNGLPQSEKLKSKDFSVEMETGTGKTYVYLRSIFKLNAKYGFTKFIIVVPSIAIKEGAKKSLEITNEHFKGIFNNVQYDYFVYDSSNLEQVRDFATSSDIRIMIINIDAFKKSFADPSKDNKANLIHRTNDRLNGQKPIDFISSTNPIVIIDEPQSVDNTPKSKEAIATLNPLCRLRYSATHIDKHNLMYKLDSIDAYEQKLVKQIEVANVHTTENANQAYIELKSVKATPRSAVIEIDINKDGKTKREAIIVKAGSILEDLSNGRDVYRGFDINDIYIEKGNEYIQFTNGTSIGIGESIGDMDEDTIKRLQIRKTIEEHLNKELLLNPKGIKVLSLFFIDEVANYRTYDESGNSQKGKFAIWFEEEYKKIVKYRKYQTLFGEIKDLDEVASKVHDGYFSQDKNGRFKNSSQNATGELKSNADDEKIFDKIMKNKEKLLSFSEPLRFIFSHSALKEGWDNPNVFQICALKNGTKSEIRRRQEIGRGLRICVNQDGERVYGFDVNTLTIMANETFEEFAEGLQKEIEKDENIKFGVIESHLFANITTKDENDNVVYLGAQNSKKLHSYLIENNYITSSGKITDNLKTALKDNTFSVPDEFQSIENQVISVIKKLSGNLNLKNAEDKTSVKINKYVLLSNDFKDLWEQIKYKTTYRVKFNENKLIDKCVLNIKNELVVGKVKYVYSKATNKITKVGVEIDEETLLKDKYIDCEIIDYKLPDIITYLQNETNLTRRAIVEILVKSEKLKDFQNNPQKFIDKAIEIIKKTMNLFIIDGISYKKLGNSEYYAQECFEDEELFGYMTKNMFKNRDEKSIYDYTIYDSDVEKTLAQSFNDNPDVKLFTKLPSWFKINTPLGGYNPDWAILIEKDGADKLYFVIESKGNLFGIDLRDIEASKIECAKKHFAAIDSKAKVVQANSFESFMEYY